MKKLYVICAKNRDGSVAVYKPNDNGPASLWVTFDKFSSLKPDYRHKYVTLNCYRYPILWDRPQALKHM